MSDQPSLDDFPLRARDKLRYGDTDRQGHVNNAVFATFMETGRVEALYAPAFLGDEGCAFVIARLSVDFRAEINWPGEVVIGTRLAALGRSSLQLEQALFQDGRLVATSQSAIVQMNETTRRSAAFSDAARDRIERAFAKPAGQPA